jgi:hypothetical protein
LSRLTILTLLKKRTQVLFLMITTLSTLCKGGTTGSKPDWRKRLTSVTRYIEELESCLTRANVTITTQEQTIRELNQHIQHLVSLLGTVKGGCNEHR